MADPKRALFPEKCIKPCVKTVIKNMIKAH